MFMKIVFLSMNETEEYVVFAINLFHFKSLNALIS